MRWRQVSCCWWWHPLSSDPYIQWPLSLWPLVSEVRKICCHAQHHFLSEQRGFPGCLSSPPFHSLSTCPPLLWHLPHIVMCILSHIHILRQAHIHSQTWSYIHTDPCPACLRYPRLWNHLIGSHTLCHILTHLCTHTPGFSIPSCLEITWPECRRQWI